MTANRATAANSAQPIPATDSHVLAARKVRDAAEQAEGALVAALLLAVSAGRFLPEHLTAAGYAEGTAKVYASEWNAGAAVASIVGETQARSLIMKTAKAYPLGTYRAVLAALRAVKDKARAGGVKEATPQQARELVKDAPNAARDADEKRRGKKAAARGPRGQTAGTMAAAATLVAVNKSWKEAAAGTRLIANTLAGAAVPEGMDAQARAFLKALGDAVEAGAPFLRSVAQA